MNEIWKILLDGYSGYANYIWNEICNPSWHNYFYALTIISFFFFLLEVVIPWRKNQKVIRLDFWLDFFYMYFNFFVFSLIIYQAGSDVVVHFVRKMLTWITSIDFISWNPLKNWPLWAIFLTGFVIRDFIQWWTHRLLHRVPFLWNFHKVHHSVKEMGFAAHLRYHWMETIVYRTIEYLPLAFLGIGLYDFYFIHIFSLAIGHYNHSNISISKKTTGLIFGGLIGLLIGTQAWDIRLIVEYSIIGLAFSVLIGMVIGYFILSRIMKILFNHPEMHIWHHAKFLPPPYQYGINFGLSLAIWDFIFGTAYIPKNGMNIELGFERDETFPKNFISQFTYGIFMK